MAKKNKEMKLPYGLFTVLSLVIIAAVFLAIHLNGEDDDKPSDGIKPDNVAGDVKDTESEFKEDPNAQEKPDQKEEDQEENSSEDETETKPEDEPEDTVTPPLEIETVPEGYTVYLGLDVSEDAMLENENPFSDPDVEKQIAKYFASFSGIEGVENANLVVVYSGEKIPALWDYIQSAIADTASEQYFSVEEKCIRVGAAGLDGQVANILATEGVACIYRENRTDATECLVLSVKPVRREAYEENEN